MANANCKVLVYFANEKIRSENVLSLCVATVLCKDDPFDGYKNEILCLTEFLGKFKKITIVSMVKSLNCHNSGSILDKSHNFWFYSMVFGVGQLNYAKFGSDRLLLPW